MTNMLTLPLDFLRECFVYDAADGTLWWKARPRAHFVNSNAHSVWNSKHAGKLAGSPNAKRRWSTKINGKLYQNHRLVWALSKGEWPVDQIDHINGNPEDNRLENTRVVSNTENQKNRWMSRANTSGINGVYWHTRNEVWTAYIRRDGKQHHLGQFSSREAAQKARRDAERELGYTARHGTVLG